MRDDGAAGGDAPGAFNSAVAAVLRDIAAVLSQQGANHFRVNAYRRAANTIDDLDVDLRGLIKRQGLEGLLRLPGIGHGLAPVVDEIVRTGRAARLDRLNGALEPENLFQSVPGIGPGLARLIHDQLQIDSLEELEIAAYDGRLDDVPGIGNRRIAAIRANLASLLGTRRPLPTLTPDVAAILDVDREYRERTAAGTLEVIAPRRFNPTGKKWLPVLHTHRDGWHFTALFSNTARAHELGRTSDWVVVYFYDDDHREGQHTVVTERSGELAGRRVVRGREFETARLYRSGYQEADEPVTSPGL